MDIRSKRLVLIGGAGLIGSHTADLLLEEDIKEMIIFDNFSRGKIENLNNVIKDPRVKIIEGDIIHTDILESVLNEVDGVFHFAAMWLLHCHEFPRSAFQVNVAGTFNVMDACIKKGVKRLVFSSSASVYGDALYEPMDEDHPFNNKNFYGATKIACEAMLRAYHHRYGLNYVGLRYMNVYGPRQDYKGVYVSVIMKMLDAINKGIGPTIYGNGEEGYDFIYVKDCARANILAMKSEISDRFYNIGTGEKTTLKDLAELLIKLTGSEQKINYLPREDDTIVKNRIGDPSRAFKELGFKAKVDLKEGLKRLIKWRNTIEHNKGRAYGYTNN